MFLMTSKPILPIFRTPWYLSKNCPRSFWKKMARYSGVKILWVLGVASLKITVRTWKMDGWKMDLAYLQWKHVSFRKWSCFFSFFVFFITRTSTKFGTGDEPDRCLWTPNRWFRPKEAALKPTLEVGQDGFTGRSGEEGFLFGWMICWDFPSGPWIFVPRKRGFSMGPDVVSSSPWWLLQGKKATAATEMDGIFITFECQNAFKETVAFKVPFVSLLCCFESIPWMHITYYIYRLF